MNTLIQNALRLFGPLTPVQVQEKLMIRGHNYNVDYITNEMFLEADKKNGLFVFADADYSSPENRLYKIR